MMAECGPFEYCPAVAVAVSGGCDSMALVRQAQEWAQTMGGSVIALTVDHGLRPEAAQEAEQVAAWCHGLGVAHQTLRWQPPAPLRNIQQQARDARYTLLSGWCREHNILHLLTAHTQDDQCETLFFRLARQSQFEGLAAMPLVSDVYGVRLLRPLLRTRKAEIISFLERSAQDWLEDASNALPVYTRNRIRQQLTQAEGISGQAAVLASGFADIRNALFFNNVSLLTECAEIFPEGYARLDIARFNALPEDAAVRVLGALICALNGQFHAPRREALQRLFTALCQGRGEPLGGLVFRVGREQILIAREQAALPAPLPLPRQWQGLWDGRFRVDFSGPGGFTLRPLGSDGLAQAMAEVALPSCARVPVALRALPSLWHLDSLVAAPHIGYCKEGADIRFDAVLRSAKPLAGSPFFGLNRRSETLLQER